MEKKAAAKKAVSSFFQGENQPPHLIQLRKIVLICLASFLFFGTALFISGSILLDLMELELQYVFTYMVHRETKKVCFHANGAKFVEGDYCFTRVSAKEREDNVRERNPERH